MIHAWAAYQPGSARWLVFWSETCERPGFGSSCTDLARVYARFVVDGGCGGSGGEELFDPPICLDNPLEVADGSDGASYVPAAAFNPTTETFFAAWTQFAGDDPDASDVYGRWLTSQGSGGALGQAIAVHANPVTEEKTPEAAGHVACSQAGPYCLVVLNEYEAGTHPSGPEYWANLLGVFVAPQEACSVEISELWPPNHRFVDVGLEAGALDSCDSEPPSLDITISSDEHPTSESGSGGAVHCPDAILGEDGSVWLRAERSGAGDGRVYRITAALTDSCGHVVVCEATVGVPHDHRQTGGSVDSGQYFDATVCN